MAEPRVKGDKDSLLNHNKNVMDSLDKSCNELKHAYDSCFNTWFAETFLKDHSKDLPNPCEAILKTYSECVKKAMRARNMDPAVYAEHWKEAENHAAA